MNTRRAVLTALALIVAAGAASADGVTSTNYSAAQIKTGNRNATSGPEAAFFNPAGTVRGPDGFTFEGSNLMSPYTADKIHDSLLGDYSKTSTSWFFPAVNLTFKKANWSLFSSLAPSQAGGAGTLSDGAPALAWGAAKTIGDNLTPLVQAGQLTGAQAVAIGAALKAGQFTVKQDASGGMGSVGASLGGAYAVNDLVSVAAAGRYVYQWNHMEAKISSFTVGGVNYLQTPVEVNIDQTGSCAGFVAGVDLRPLPGLVVANTFQFYTALEMKTKVNDMKDGGGLYKDGATSKATYSPEWSLGVSYAVVPALVVTADTNLFFNKLVDTEFQSRYNDLSWNGGLGIEWQTTDKLNLGTGFTYSPVNQKDSSQNDLEYSLGRVWCNLGATYDLLPNLALTAAGQTAFNLGDSTGKGAGGEAQTYSTTSLPFTVAVGAAYRL